MTTSVGRSVDPARPAAAAKTRGTKVDDNTTAMRCTGMTVCNVRVGDDRARTGGAVSHLRRTQRLLDEDDAPFWWEEFRLLVPLGNVGRLYTGSSRPSASSFLSRISDSSDPASRNPGFFLLVVVLVVVVWYSRALLVPR